MKDFLTLLAGGMVLLAAYLLYGIAWLLIFFGVLLREWSHGCIAAAAKLNEKFEG